MLLENCLTELGKYRKNEVVVACESSSHVWNSVSNNQNLDILLKEYDKKTLKQTGLLSIKPKIFVCNVDEQSVQNGNNYTQSFIDKYVNNKCINTKLKQLNINHMIIIMI